MSLTKAAECAIKCGEPLFRSFLKERMSMAQSQRLMTGARQVEPWETVRTKEDAAIAVRFLLDIDSRRDLDSDREAGERWRKLEGEYFMWSRGE